MTRSTGRILGLPRLIALGIIGAFIGWFVASEWNPLPLGPRTRIVPYPYVVPKIPGGTSLRVAMVHDILHERYLRHGTAWYAQRITDSRKTIAQWGTVPPSDPPPAYLDAMDNLAIGLERTGQYEEGIATMRSKLLLIPPLPDAPATRTTIYYATSQPSYIDYGKIDQSDLRRILDAQSLTPIQLHQYSTCANLGTILVHSAMPKALGGDADAKARVREGLGYIERAIAINPGAHFGRETWQAIAIEDLLAAMDHPDLLKNYDLIGDDLTSSYLGFGLGYPAYRFRRSLRTTDPNLTPDERLEIRSDIPRVGIDSDWANFVQPDYSVPMPFDEPTLAIIGMWTLGGGPSPHFALALGRIMENVGENYIAWNSYERAVEMKDQFWPDPAICDQLVAICRARQSEIAKNIAPSAPDAWQDTMRKQHQSELAWGIAYQKAYQDYEASQIKAGVSLDDPNFYKAFFQNRPSIASDPGLADDIEVTYLKAPTFADCLPCIILGLGLGMFLALIIPEKHLS